MISRMKNQWIAVHIFYQGNLDLVLIHLVAPFIEQFSLLLNVHTPYFFIRYGEGGSHIRLRMNFIHEVAAQKLVAALENEAGVFFKRFPVEKKDDDPLAETQAAGNRIAFLPYEPEFVRYGGITAMPWAEHHFYSASSIILNWTVNGKGGLLQALKLHLALLFSGRWTYEVCRQICQVFIEGWLPRLYYADEDQRVAGRYWLGVFETTFERQQERLLPAMEQFWGQLGREAVTEDLKDFMKINTGVLSAYRNAGFSDHRLLTIVSSMLHMNNNRLGIPNHEEAYVVYVVMQVLSFIDNKNE